MKINLKILKPIEQPSIPKDVYELVLNFESKNTPEQELVWHFTNSLDLIKALKVIELYLSLDWNTRCNASMYECIPNLDSAVDTLVCKKGFKNLNSYEDWLVSLSDEWPYDMHCDCYYRLDSYDVFYYNVDGNKLSVQVN